MSEYDKPSKAEDEYFARQEFERRKKWAAEQAAKTSREEKEKLKALHYMKCPKDGNDLHTIEVHGVKVDQCGVCNGTWFDAGEVEMLSNPKNSGLFGKVMSIFK